MRVGEEKGGGERVDGGRSTQCFTTLLVLDTWLKAVFSRCEDVEKDQNTRNKLA